MAEKKTFTDAIAKLKHDHDVTEALFERVKNAEGAEAKKLGIQVCNLVKIHMTLEEEYFYPALRGKQEADEDKLNEGLIEHDSGKVLVNDVLADSEQDTFKQKIQVLGEQMEHHHQEEEAPAKGVFWMAREAGLDLVAMLDQMLAREAELKAELKEGDLPPADMNFVDVAASDA